MKDSAPKTSKTNYSSRFGNIKMIKDFIIVIPARFQSSRFEGKPLCMLNGKSMITRVYHKCLAAVDGDQNLVYVATDDEKIKAHCIKEKLNVVMTPSDCLTGTDRLGDVAKYIDAHTYINVQGDEPLILPSDIQLIINESKKYPHKLINAMTEIHDEEEFKNPNVPKVVTTPEGRLLYMSRATIPTTKKLQFKKAFKQVCIYAFPKNSLMDFCDQLEKTPLEEIEDIEILRFLEIGYEVKMVVVSGNSVAVDTPEDAKKVDLLLREVEVT
jgi:3-deoxy-manno-octulosonate cytidylyltransferase (CMP-KDO synthetase)